MRPVFDLPGGFSVRLRLLSCARSCGRDHAPRHGVGVGADRPEREQRRAQGRRKGNALLSYRARGKQWNVLASGAMNALAPTTARKQLEFKLDYSGGWGTKRNEDRLEDPLQRAAGPRRPRAGTGSSPPARRPTGATGRCSRGSACSRTTGSRRARSIRLGAPPLPLERPDRRARREDELGLPLASTTSSARSPTSGSRSSASSRSRRASRSTPSAATSTSTRSTRRTARGWRRENSFLTHKGTGCSVTASTATGAVRSARDSATARP